MSARRRSLGSVKVWPRRPSRALRSGWRDGGRAGIGCLMLAVRSLEPRGFVSSGCLRRSPPVTMKLSRTGHPMGVCADFERSFCYFGDFGGVVGL